MLRNLRLIRAILQCRCALFLQQAVHRDCIASPTRVVESVLREMVNSVVNGEGEKMLHPLPVPPTEFGSSKDPEGPTKWHDQCLYECMKCGKRGYDIRRMKRHCRNVHDDGKCQKKLTDVVYECIMCSKEMSCDGITIESHVRSWHGLRTLGEFSVAYTIDEHMAAVKNLSDENAARIRSAEVWSEKQMNGTTQGTVSFVDK